MFLQISLKPGLIEDSWILPSTSAFNLLCMALVEVYEEKTLIFKEKETGEKQWVMYKRKPMVLSADF